MAVGTELLLGQIPNTNAQRISQELAAIGVGVYHHTAVGDNPERAAAAIATALARSDAVVVTGGLGPTTDDVTAAAVAAALGVRLVRRDDLVEVIRGVFARAGRVMPRSNLKQADLPEKATPIPPEGTAPGFVVDTGACVLFALPGVPWEMEAMLATAVVPELRRRAGGGTIVSREILVVGPGESATQERIGDIVAAQQNPTIAYLAGHGRVRVRVTARATDEGAALALIAPVEAAVRARLGDDAVPGHHRSPAGAVASLLRARGATVGVAESLTAGLIAAELAESPGASDVFAGSLVVYATRAKRDVAGVDAAILEGPGPVSDEAAAALAERAAAVFSADLGLSATGVAGPAEQDGKPVGTIYVGASLGGDTDVRLVKGHGDRAHIRGLAATAALDLGRRVLQRR